MGSWTVCRLASFKRCCSSFVASLLSKCDAGTPEFSNVTSPSDLALHGWIKHDSENLYLAFNISDNLLYAEQTARWTPKANPNANVLNQSGWPVKSTRAALGPRMPIELLHLLCMGVWMHTSGLETKWKFFSQAFLHLLRVARTTPLGLRLLVMSRSGKWC
eukprot:SAG31_NODE_41_length_31342_cov_8.029286_21_plen_161_part_00